MKTSGFTIALILLSVSALCISIASIFQIKKLGGFALDHQLITWAEDLYPLDGRHEYVLKKNAQGNFGDGEYIVPAGSFYVLEIPGESEPEMQHMASGRKVGSTQVDLAQYEGKKVFLEGRHYLGEPMFLVSETQMPLFIRSKNQAVIHIERVSVSQ